MLPEERLEPRTVRINLRIECDLARAGRTDRLEDTVDYRAVRDRVREAVRNSSDALIERLAQRAAEAALCVAGVRKVTVCLDKPGALEAARSVAVEITRTRPAARTRSES